MIVSNILNAIKKLNSKINDLQGKILYENTSGTTGTVTLSDSSSNYKYLEIFYRSNDDLYGSIKVSNPNGKNIVIVSAIPHNNSNNCYLKSTSLNINSNKITVNSYSEVALKSNGELTVDTDKNCIYITKVLGYI